MPLREWERFEEPTKEGLTALLKEGESDRSVELDSLMRRTLVKLYGESFFLSDVDRFRRELYMKGASTASTHGIEITTRNVTAIVTKLLTHEQELPPSLQGQIQVASRAINAFCFYPYIPAAWPSSPIGEAAFIATSNPLVNRDIPPHGLTPSTFYDGVERVLNQMLKDGFIREKSPNGDFKYVYMTSAIDKYLK